VGFVFKARIAPGGFAAYLDAPVSSVHQWDDWAQIGGKWVSFDWDDPDNVAAVLGEVDGWHDADTRRPQTHREAWSANLEASEDVPGGTFWYTLDRDGLVAVTIARALFGEDLSTLIALLTEFRGIAPFLTGAGETASIVRSDVWWGEPEERDVQAVAIAKGGSSVILSPGAPPCQPLVAGAQAVFASRDAYSDDDDDDDDDPDLWPDDSAILRAWTPRHL
jgi:hypothetical protein